MFKNEKKKRKKKSDGLYVRAKNRPEMRERQKERRMKRNKLQGGGQSAACGR
jgi:hypothetical protein